MAPVRRLIIALVLAWLPAAPALSFLRPPDGSAADRAWARGPVWYIMTTAEYREYVRLRGAAQRRSFIRDFWNRRDPIPETPQNELEREFWRRVEVADGHFGQDVKPGWKTERGKVFILLGPPENLETDHILSDRWGASRWVYDLGAMPVALRLVLQDCLRIPAGRRFANLRVREESAGSRAVLDTAASGSSVLRPTGFLPLAEVLVRRLNGPEALRSLGHAMRLPEVIERERSEVRVATLFSLVPVEARIDFRPARSAMHAPPLTSVAVTLGVRQADLQAAGASAGADRDAVLTGHLTPIDDEAGAIALTGAFAPAPDGGAGQMAVYQALCRVAPGRYLLDVAYRDASGLVTGSVREVIDVPSFSTSGLAISSLVLSSRLEPGGRGDGPFTLGRYRVVPKTTCVYTQPARLTVYYEIYEAATDAGGEIHVDLDYQFYLEDGSLWLPVGPAIPIEDRRDAEQAWSVPLDGWPEGRYRLEVTVTDRVTGDSSARGTIFEIAPAPRTTSLR